MSERNRRRTRILIIAAAIALVVFAGVTVIRIISIRLGLQRARQEMELESMINGGTPEKQSTGQQAVSEPVSTSEQGAEEPGDVTDLFGQDPADAEIVTDPRTGVTFVKNQLMVSCKEGTDRAQVEEICEGIDATIVGYIELTSDFLIEFNTDCTYLELEEKGQELESDYDFIRMAVPNLANEILPEAEE